MSSVEIIFDVFRHNCKNRSICEPCSSWSFAFHTETQMCPVDVSQQWVLWFTDRMINHTCGYVWSSNIDAQLRLVPASRSLCTPVAKYTALTFTYHPYLSRCHVFKTCSCVFITLHGYSFHFACVFRAMLKKKTSFFVLFLKYDPKSLWK